MIPKWIKIPSNNLEPVTRNFEIKRITDPFSYSSFYYSNLVPFNYPNLYLDLSHEIIPRWIKIPSVIPRFKLIID